MHLHFFWSVDVSNSVLKLKVQSKLSKQTVQFFITAGYTCFLVSLNTMITVNFRQEYLVLLEKRPWALISRAQVNHTLLA